MKVGLFFGSFNPIHIGHLIIANIIYEYSELDELWFVVSPLNPHKRHSKSLIHEFDRYDMVQIAIENHNGFKVSDIEFNLPKPNYTIDTLAYLSEKYPNYNFKVIVGGDNLKSFKKWKNHSAILENYGLLVYPRPDSDTNEFGEHEKVKLISAPLMDISASFIRKCIKEQKSIKYLVPEKVSEHIALKKLYQ